MTAALLAAALVAGAVPEVPGTAGESPRSQSLTLRGQMYYPNIDAELPAVRPFETVFRSKRRWVFRGDWALALWQGVGTVEAGAGVGFLSRTGRGIFHATNPPQRSEDDTGFRMIPVNLSLGYRFDWLSRRYGIPFELHAKASLERYHWWVTDGSGGTSEKGATNGYSFTAGAGFLLDFLDSGLARELDRDSGVNDTWLVVDVTKSVVDDFGSSKSWDLSDEKLSIGFGLMFVF